MNNFQTGEIVARKSYGGDIPFKIAGVTRDGYGRPVYLLKGLFTRLEADAYEDDLVKQDKRQVVSSMENDIETAGRKALERIEPSPFLSRTMRAKKPGKILQVDSSREFLDKCLKHYRDAGLTAAGELVDEEQQPYVIRSLLTRNRPDILVITGHDGIKKGAVDMNSISSYRNSRHFIRAAGEARRVEPDADKLCIFAGACQSYYEAIMTAGANFASAPERVLIHLLDPALVSTKVALTDSRVVLSPEEVVRITITGAEGIGGTSTRGRMEDR